MTKKHTLKNGVRLLYEQIPHIRSVSAGIWVDCGSKNETPEINGVSHFIEHMMFKGSRARTAAELAHDMDMLGALMNAFTAKEHTCYHVKCLDDDLYAALDILCEMFHNPLFEPDAIERERRVILEEIGMYLDTPEDVATEELTINAFKPHSFSLPILGTKETVSRITRGDLVSYMKSLYTAENIVVAVAGSFDEDRLIAYIENAFGGVKRGAGAAELSSAGFNGGEIFIPRNIEQNHINLGFESVGRRDPRSYALPVISLILGDGMSSRLYQTLREQSGLCYNVYSFNMPISDTGMFVIGAAYSPESEAELTAKLDESIEAFAREGATREEFVRAKKQIITNLIMSFESSSSRMPYIARGELLYGYVRTPDELIAQIEGVTREQINELARKMLTGRRMKCTVGRRADDL
ncbi:MAG: insulinase family protein [Clostridia bacterium]|nr:insulinase family protein [Clostridia bacterium]